MFKYIGIRGHRGAGKKTISYLLGNAIESIIENIDWNERWDELMDEIMYEDFIYNHNLKNVQFESFADTLFVMIHSLLNIPMEFMTDDYLKDNVFINMRDFSFVKCDKLDSKPTPIINSIDLFNQRYNEIDTEYRPKTFRDDIYMSLRDFIHYFGYTMQSFFGLNTWVKSLDRNKSMLEKFYAEHTTIYKIFIDVKYPSEATYIKNNEGVIVKCLRPDNIKEDTVVSTELDFDNRVDYELDIRNINELKDVIYNIAKELI